jgi:hypothetical protein
MNDSTPSKQGLNHFDMAIALTKTNPYVYKLILASPIACGISGTSTASFERLFKMPLFEPAL